MNYEKKLALAKEALESGSYDKKTIEYIFPELKESEEEKIRNWLIGYFHQYKEDGMEKYANGLKVDSIIAWLEKQGEQEINDEDTIQSYSFYSYKGEPDFKVGDWIVDNCGYIWKIEGILNQFYILEGVEGGESRPTIEWVDKTCHLWTIRDAKDGDVLCYEDEISLYKHDIKNCTKQETTFGGFVYYCCYDGKRFITDSLYSLTEQDKTDIHPATKEQRDLLFSKMKEAGYEWDDENKELKKIEQKPNNSQFTPEQADILDKHIDNFLGRKFAWSKDDERMCNASIRACRYMVENFENSTWDYEDAIDWLNSLKNCVQPQNNTITSDELAKAKKEAYNDALDKIEYHSGVPSFDDGWSAAIWYIKKKNIGFKNTWKPSEEQIQALEYQVHSTHEDSWQYKASKELLEQLKKL